MQVGAMISTTTLMTGYLVLSITAILIGIVYMVGKALHIPKLIGWAKHEGAQSLATAIFIAFAVTIVVGADYMATQLIINMGKSVGFSDNILNAMQDQLNVHSTNGNYIQTEAHFVPAQTLLQAISDKLGYKLKTIYTISSVLNYIDITKAFPEKKISRLGDVINIGGIRVLDTIRNISYSALQYIYYGFLFLYLQQGLIMLVKQFFFYTFPAGLFLRGFPFTRSVGSFLIAISLGMYFVYPTFYGLMLVINSNDMGFDEDDIQEAFEDASMAFAQDNLNMFTAQYLRNTFIHSQKNLKDTTTNGIISEVEGFAKDHPIITGMTAAILIPAAPIMAAGAAIGSITTNYLGDMFSYISFVLKTLVLYPLIAFTITYSFIHQLSALLQANISELGRGLVRLV